MESFIQHHVDKIIGVVSGWDRLRFRGTLRMLAHVSGLDRFMRYQGRLLKDFGAYAEEVSRQTRTASLAVAEAAGRPVVHLSRPGVNKEDVARGIQERDGIKEGLIAVLTAVEPCGSYNIRSNKASGKLELEHAWRKCQHLYHYLQHPEFGRMNVRLQTWFPFNQFVCINGREWLGRQMDRAGIKYVRRDNCFVWVSDVAGAQELLNRQVSFNWSKALGELSAQVNPALASIVGSYRIEHYWSLNESEWATDLMFKGERELSGLYPHLIRHGMEAMRCRDALRFLGQRVPAQGVNGNLKAEVVCDLKQRPEGIRLKHRVGSNSVKMYNKQGSVLRVETTLNNMRELKSPRVKDGKVVWAKMRKGVSDMARRAEVCQGANQRYLQAMAAAEVPTALKDITEDLAKPVRREGRRTRGLNLLGSEDARLLELVGDGQYLLHGFRNRDLREAWFGTVEAGSEQRRQSGQMTRKIGMLRLHGLIKKVSGTHRYLVTEKGRKVIAALTAARAADIEKLAKAA